MKNFLIILFSITTLTLSACEISTSNDSNQTIANISSTRSLNANGGDFQFGGSFSPSNAPYGGFGGASGCTASKTPIIFVHGNGGHANHWAFVPNNGELSTYHEFKYNGYKDCELFGLNIFDPAELTDPMSPSKRYHNRTTARLIRDFINDVIAYTGRSKVNIVAHSMGVTLALHGIDYGNLWGKINKFVNISGGVQGLAVCYWMGYMNPIAPTCGGQNFYDSEAFGFYPDLWSWTYWRYINPRFGKGSKSFYKKPYYKSNVKFYTISSNKHDMILCSTYSYYSGCGERSKFGNYSNVKAQLDVGFGSKAVQMDFDFSDYTYLNAWAGDKDGVGHFRAKNNTGKIVRNMLTTSCSGTGCCAGYSDRCVNF